MKNILSFSFFIVALLFYISCTPGQDIKPDDPSNTDTVMKDIFYGSADKSKQSMDVYLPKGRNSHTKVIVLVHGGAWSAGDKSEMKVLISKIQKEWPEVAIANINYRLANGSTVIHTEIANDIKTAIQYIANHKEEWQISDEMGLIGASAGAHLALLYAYKSNIKNHVKAVCDLFGPAHFADWEYYNSYNILLGDIKEIYKTYTGEYWNEELYKSISPYHLVNSDNYVPTIIFHGTLDPVVPIYQSQWFRGKLNDLGLESAYYEYTGEFHGFNDANYKDCMKKTVKFFKEKI